MHIFVFMCTFCILGYAKIACAVFAHFEIFDVLVEWYSTACSRVSFAFPNGIGELNACASPRFDEDGKRPLSFLSSMHSSSNNSRSNSKQ